MYNKIILNGRLTADAEVKKTSNDKIFYSFGIAVTRTFKKGDDWKKETEFINCILWKEISKYINKGTLVLIEGELRNTKKEDGTYFMYVNVQKIIKQCDSKESVQKDDASEISANEKFDSDDLQF